MAAGATRASPCGASPTFPMSMSPRRRAEINVLQAERDRDHDDADHREQPEHVDIGQKIHLLLQGLPDPGDGLAGRIGRVRPLRLEVSRHGIDGLLIAEIGWRYMLGQPALM